MMMFPMLVAQGEGAAPVGADRLIQFGVLGIMVVLFLTGWIVTGSQYKRVLAENEAMKQLLVTDVIPLLEKTGKRLEDNTDIIKRLIQSPPAEWHRIDLPLSPGDSQRRPPDPGG